NEGFATWMTPHPLEQWKPEWMLSQGVVGGIDRSLSVDSVKNTRPIHQAAETRAEIEQLFDGIAYGKTASVLHMLESYLGRDTFRAGVNLYLKEHAYGNATAADFWDAMARSSKKPVDKIMPTFVMQPGAPYVGVDAKCEGGSTTLDISQKRYFNTPQEFQQPSAQGYYRFNYDAAAMRQLGNAVEKGLTPDERIALMGNEWALMRIGQHDVGDYLAL